MSDKVEEFEFEDLPKFSALNLDCIKVKNSNKGRLGFICDNGEYSLHVKSLDLHRQTYDTFRLSKEDIIHLYQYLKAELEID